MTELRDDEDWPAAYLITFRTFGTWLHGDPRGSVDLHESTDYGTKRREPNANLEAEMRENQRVPAFKLDSRQRAIVEAAIRDVCSFRSYGLIAIHVRTNHAHVVVSAHALPEKVMNAFKANATRELRLAGLIGDKAKIWSRGGSTRYLWKSGHVQTAIAYVIDGQGGPLPNF